MIVFIALAVVIAVLAIVLWRITGGDDGDDGDDDGDAAVASAGGASEASEAPDASEAGDGEAGDEDDEDDEGDGGDEGEAGQDAPETPSASSESDETTTAPISTTTFTTTVPANPDRFGPAALSARSSVSTVGLDTVHFGMSVRQAEIAAGTPLIPIAPVSGCYHVVPYKAPEGIVFLVYSGTIERVDINSGPVTTRSGVGIGSTDETVISLFGDSIERSIRSDGTVELILVPRDVGDSQFRVVFNVADGQVRAYKAGRLPHILTETGCS